ncbi:alpha-(1,3)-fucosyltransferase C-like [Penaeus japonicus]|uniref:alpha-(1,3)-fucosyltransferase C-like n=1 Tax=Penaeus japonicus TaxID=27405 RepID=UPI001C7123E5|nr:alpha-(1,3)-fucosyltransferase C-like [Penaeus japonicus]
MIIDFNFQDFRTKHYGFGFGRAPFVRAGCRVDACLTTGQRHRFPPEEIDALIWHFRSDDKSLPEKRFPHARYVFWVLESASYLYDISRFDGIFNWTMTYRLDSDFPRPYSQVYRRKKPLDISSTRNYAKGKTKMAAWFVSHCNLSEEEKCGLVDTLQQWIEVDIFGACGPLKCELSQQYECHKALNETYKFYLAFENSLCQDYVTEKLFNMLELDVIPVVYGLGNYSVQAPPHSYIDALSFPTAKDLADYLLYLHGNDTAYNEYFTWKTDYFVSGDWIQRAQAFCALCESLHADNSTKVYDLSKWFVEEAHCLAKTMLEIRDFIGGHQYHPIVVFLSCTFMVLGIVAYGYFH